MVKFAEADDQEAENGCAGNGKRVQIFRSEEALLDEDFADAEESHSGVMQVVNALQLELKELQCD